MENRKPVLALDIDGVLALDDPSVPVTQVSVSAWHRWRREIALPVEAAQIVAQLARDFDIVWASAWGHNAHTAMRPVLDLPDAPWPFLPVQFNKIPVVARYAAGRRWGLVEEQIADLSGLSTPASGFAWRVPADLGITAVDPAELLRQVHSVPC